MELIEKLEKGLLLNAEQPECLLVHNFSNGVYVRELTMPTDSIIVGHEHRTQHLNIISKGSCILLDLDTKETIDIVAPYTFESKAGVRKVLYIVEECTWSTVHVTQETELDKLEAELIVKSDTYIKNNKELECLG